MAKYFVVSACKTWCPFIVECGSSSFREYYVFWIEFYTPDPAALIHQVVFYFAGHLQESGLEEIIGDIFRKCRAFYIVRMYSM